MFYLYQEQKLYYKVMGQGKPVLLIHGLGCSSELMEGCMEPIFERQAGYKRIYIDLPGMGRSDANAAFASADAILNLLLHFIDDVIGSSPFLLAGESYGGYLSRGILARKMAQVEGLLLICPVTKPYIKDRILPESDVVVSEPSFDMTGKDEEFFSVAILQTEKTYQRFEKEILYSLRMMNLPFIQKSQENYALSFDPDQEIQSHGYDNPSLFIAGKQDQIVGFQQLADLSHDYPRSTYAVLDVAGHNAQIDQEELFTALVENWLRRIKTI
ncbi:hydrolase, alpha/beta fold family [Streptococcus sp. DD11]|uniref:alpha/beta fold hydrolase n=1 Tax=Streptococcus sp. DD11 TaxID=1777879 RepID=UPI000795F927|nr:alpha/beta hydrolase [Streptococcus sp. DD11]KXT84091.1 hydrolase, alpha/beta fold family [Streptococcus sp. DD11]